MQRPPYPPINAMIGDSNSETGSDSPDAFSRIVENAIRNGRLTAAEITELRSVVTAALGLDTPAEETPARDIDWRTPSAARGATLH
jgi:hypothetical protein